MASNGRSDAKTGSMKAIGSRPASDPPPPKKTIGELNAGKKGHVVEIHHADGVRAHLFKTKKEAHAFGMAARRRGQTAYAFPANSEWRQTSTER